MRRLNAATLTLLIMVLGITQSHASESIAFYYGPIERLEVLALYDRVVVQPNHLSVEQLQNLKTLDTKVYAYFSLVEHFSAKAQPESPTNTTQKSKQLKAPSLNLSQSKEAILGKNSIWGSSVMDLTHPVWRKHLQNTAEYYKQQGFDGLFLDTVDSYHLGPSGTQAIKRQQQAAITLIKALSSLFNQNLIMNRGFELLDMVKTDIKAVAAESILQGYDRKSGYFQTTEQDRQWIIQQLKLVKKTGLEAIGIDYVPQASSRKAAAKALITLGLTPYVSDGLLQEFGTSLIAPLPNRMLALFDSEKHNLLNSPIFAQLSLPFERAGYPIAFHDIQNSTLPKNLSSYAGVIIWLPDHSFPKTKAFAQWLKRWQKEKTILWIDTAMSPTVERLLGMRYLALPSQAQRKRWAFDDTQSFTGFETTLDAIRHSATHSLKLSKPDQKALINVITESGQKTLLASAPWGVAAAKHSLFTTDPFQDDRWLINPKVLIHELLGLAVIPVADATTENGRRIATAHIDGDGFPSKSNLPGTPFTADVIHREVLEQYTNIPTTVSVIEGEISAAGLHPSKSAELEAIAKEIFRLPHVEIASHSFSHPFYWGSTPVSFNDLYGRHLKIPNYTLDFNREITGSLNYINTQLAPANKKAKVFLWSGYADPKATSIALTAEAGVENVNGGNTYVTADKFLLSNISPTLIPYESGIQVLAPTMNENIYTNLWTRNFGGYARAVETFELLDQGERLKSIAIYYHMYSAEFPAALKALKSVYDWVLTQDINPMWLSDYAKRARTSYDLAIGTPLSPDSKTDSARWTVVSQGTKTLRLPETLAHQWDHEPWANSDLGIAGWRSVHGDTYIHLARDKTQIIPKPHYDDRPYLKDSNGQILSWHKHTPRSAVYEIHFKMQSHAPLAMRFANATHCALKYRPLNSVLDHKRNNNTVSNHSNNESGDDPKNTNAWRQAKPNKPKSGEQTDQRLITFYLDKAPNGVEGQLTCDL